MRSTGLAKSRLIAIITQIRQLSEFTTEERRAAIDTILKEVSVLTLDNEVLMCPRHAQLARGYVDRAWLYRLGAQGRVRVYRVCCKSFFGAEEIKSLPPKHKRGGNYRKVKVGVK